MPHKYDYKGKSYKEGKRTEQIFAEALEKDNRFSNIRKANIQDNSQNHIDFWTFNVRRQKEMSISVKGMKRIRRSGKKQDKLFLIELYNKAHTQNPRGWLFGTLADIIATQRKNYFMAFSVKELQKFVKQCLHKNWKQKAEQHCDNPIPYKVYYRRENIDERDYFIFIPYNDLKEKLKWDKILYE